MTSVAVTGESRKRAALTGGPFSEERSRFERLLAGRAGGVRSGVGGVHGRRRGGVRSFHSGAGGVVGGGAGVSGGGRIVGRGGRLAAGGDGQRTSGGAGDEQRTNEGRGHDPWSPWMRLMRRQTVTLRRQYAGFAPERK